VSLYLLKILNNYKVNKIKMFDNGYSLVILFKRNEKLKEEEVEENGKFW
jgi:hypothetical protein